MSNFIWLVSTWIFSTSTKQLLSTFQRLPKITLHQNTQIHTQYYFTIKFEDLIHVPVQLWNFLLFPNLLVI